jgi:hypothetical protein
MKRSTFYWQCLKRACKGAYFWASLAALIALFVCGVVAYRHPAWNETVTALMWAIPLAVFLGTAVIAWTLAPYAMYRELELASASTLKAMQESTAKLVVEREDLGWRRAELGDVKEELGLLFMTCPVVPVGLPLADSGEHDFQDFMNWFSATLTRLRELLRPQKSDQFHTVAQPFIGGAFSHVGNRTQAAFGACRHWLDRSRGEVLPDEINPNFQVRCRLLPGRHVAQNSAI